MWFDENEQFEKVLDGTWAPFALVAKSTDQPGYFNELAPLRTLSNVYSIDVVFTPDKSKWTRCMVVETGDNKLRTEGGAEKLDPRKRASVDKDGNPDNSGTQGMGWFPGYAINVETGERLNIMFGEDSWLAAENGCDMKFNPTSRYNFGSDLIFGGKHFIYIMGASHLKGDANPDPTVDCPAYDEGQWLYNKYQSALNASNSTIKRQLKTQLLFNAMWVSIPMSYGQTGAEPMNWLSNELKIRIRVARPYKRWLARQNDGASYAENNNFPVYEFNTTE